MHTPGPWEYRAQGDANHYCLLRENGTRWLLAFQQNGEVWTAEQDANANLIAAAPDLLGALRECVKVYEEHRDQQPTGHLWPDPNHIFHARNAINKAEA